MKKLRSSQQQVHNPKPVRVAPPPQWVTPQTHQQHYQPAPDQKWMTPETHGDFQDAGSQPYPHNFVPPPNWVTPEIPRGFFVSTSRLPSTPMEEGVSSSPACNSGGYPGVPHQCQSEATKPDPRTNPTGTHTRRRVLCTLPPLDPAATTSQNCTGHKVDGLLHKTKEQTKTRIAIPPQPPQAKRTQTRERPSSALLPPRDPLLHPAMITPPCPIPEGQQLTPAELRSYTHVSETKNIYIRILYYLQIFCSLQDNKFINCILRC